MAGCTRAVSNISSPGLCLVDVYRKNGISVYDFRRYLLCVCFSMIVPVAMSVGYPLLD